MTITELVAKIEQLAPPAKAASWDPVGLQLGDSSLDVEKVAVCHEVTPSVVDKAKNADIDLLVAYHPLLFRPTTRITAGTSASGRAYRLIRAGIALYVVHTAFDVATNGSADALAGALHLEDVSGFGPAWPSDQVKIVTYAPPADTDSVVAAMAERGAGRIGNYTACAFRTTGKGTFTPGDGADPAVGTPGQPNVVDEHRIEMIAPRSSADSIVRALVSAHPYEEAPFELYPVEANAGFIGRSGVLGAPTTLRRFAENVESTLGGVLRVAGDLDAQITTVACVPGSGGSFLNAVTSDVVVTGDVSHHDARAALERGVAVVDPGHAATERPGIARLYSAISAMHNVVVDLTDDPNPWRHI